MLTLADGRTRVDVTLTEPAGYSTGDGVLEVELPITGLIDATCQINKPDYRLSAAASATVPDKPLCEEGEGNALGASNYEGSVTVLRQTLTSGAVDPAADTLYTAIGEKGATAYYIERIGKKATVPLAVGDEGWIYLAESDNPQEPADRNGYIKNIVPLSIRSRRRFEIVAS